MISANHILRVIVQLIKILRTYRNVELRFEISNPVPGYRNPVSVDGSLFQTSLEQTRINKHLWNMIFLESFCGFHPFWKIIPLLSC